jgi:hypothetical protein
VTTQTARPTPGATGCVDFVSEEQTDEVVAAGTTLSYDSALRCTNAPFSGDYRFTVTIQNSATSASTVVLERLLLTHTTPRPGGSGPVASGSTADLPLTLAPGARTQVTVSGDYTLVQTGARRHANLHFCLSGRAENSEEPFSLGINAFIVGAGSPGNGDDRAAKQDAPRISNIEVNADASSTTIKWRTDKPAAAAVAYAAQDDEEERVERGERCILGLSHSVEITALKPDTAYSFRAIATDASGASSISARQNFVTRQAIDRFLFLPLLLR